MPAKRPETRRGSRYATTRGAVSAAARGLLLGAAAGLILQASPSTSRAEAAVASKPAVAPATPRTAPPAGTSTPLAKPAASAPDSAAAAQAAASPPAKPAATPPAGAAPTASSAPKAGTTGPAGAAPAVRRTTVKTSPSTASRPATMPTVRPARGSAAGAPMVGTPGTGLAAVKGRGVQAVAHLDQKLTYQYNALGRRDPFQPMVGGEFVGADVGGDAPVDVGGMKVVGIVWGTEDKFAMAEDGRGQSLVLRVGDKVMNGVVTGLRRDAVLVKLTADGQTQTVAIPLTRKGDKSNATR